MRARDAWKNGALIPGGDRCRCVDDLKEVGMTLENPAVAMALIGIAHMARSDAAG